MITKYLHGQLLIYDVIDVVPEIDNPQTCHKFKKVCELEEKSPMSALCAVNGYLLTAQGAKVRCAWRKLLTNIDYHVFV